MNRRGFLAGVIASGIAPYVSTMAGVLMPARSITRINPYIPVHPCLTDPDA